MDRNRFLANIRRELQTAQLPQAAPALAARSAPRPFDPAAQQAPFIQEATALQAEVHTPGDAAEAAAIVKGLFARYQAETFLSWTAVHLPLPALPDALTAAGFQALDGDLPAEATARKARLATLAQAPIGITGALGGLADTGTIVVQSQPGNGRLASLLPPVHITLLRQADLFPTMAHFLHAHPDALSAASNLVFISGPSRTADIEQTLTLGVHGPKSLHILLLDL